MPACRTVAVRRSRGRSGNGLVGGVPEVVRPDVAGTGGVEVGDGTVLAAERVVELAEPVSLDDDVRSGVASRGTAVDGVAPAREEVVLDDLVRHRDAGVYRVEVDGVSLRQAVEDRVVLDRQRLRAPADVDDVGVISGDVAGGVNVIALDQAGDYVYGGLEVGDVVVLDYYPRRVAVLIIDSVAGAARSRVQAADRGILDRYARGVRELDVPSRAGHNLVIVERHVVSRDADEVGNVKAAEHCPVHVHDHVGTCGAVVPARSA